MDVLAAPRVPRHRDVFLKPQGFQCPVVLPLEKDQSIDKLLGRVSRLLELLPFNSRSPTILFRIRRWLYHCETHHCRDGNEHWCEPYVNGEQPRFVIDILSCCVVPYNASMRYMALSYMWGCIDTAK